MKALAANWDEHDRMVREDAARRVETARRERLEELRRLSGVPARYLRQFADMSPTRTPSVVAVEGLDQTMAVISGGPGCGKTTAACYWLLKEFDRAQLPDRAPRFVTAVELSRSKRFGETEQITSLIRAPRVAIDDLGVEFVDDKGFFLSTIDEIVNARYAEYRPTLITTNLAAKDFKARYGERIADRIREAGRYFELANQSLRTVRL